MLVLKRHRQKDQKVKVTLSYVSEDRPGLHETVSLKKKKKREWQDVSGVKALNYKIDQPKFYSQNPGKGGRKGSIP